MSEHKFVKRQALRGWCAAALLFVLPCGGYSEFIDRIIAAVNNEIITKRDLKQAMAFNKAVSGPPHDPVQAEAETLEGLINRRLLVQEAVRFGFAYPDDKDVALELEAVKKRLGSEEAFRAMLSKGGMTEVQLTRMLAERLFVERFLEKRITIFVRVGREEALAYYQDHPGEFNGRRFSEAYRDIVAVVTAQKKERQIEQYLAELRTRSNIRMNTY